MGSPQEAEMFYLVIMVIIIGVLLSHAFKQKKPPTNTRSDAGAASPGEQPQAEAAPPEEKREAEVLQQRMAGDVSGVFVMVTTGDPQTQMVAMSLANQIKGKGKSVQVLLCDSGGDLALRGANEISFKPLNVSPHALLRKLIDGGVTVQVCPFYLPAKGKSELDLIDGVSIAAPPVIADALIEPGIKLFTF